MGLVAWISQPWPWYVAGPLIGLMVPALVLVGNRSFGISSNLRHMCAAVLPGRWAYFRYDWPADRAASRSGNAQGVLCERMPPMGK